MNSFYYNAGMYFTGDWAYRDIDGDYQIVGRKDDIVRIKGIWIQVPEIECSIVVCTTLRLVLSFKFYLYFQGKSENIENASYVRLSDESYATTGIQEYTCNDII